MIILGNLMSLSKIFNTYYLHVRAHTHTCIAEDLEEYKPLSWVFLGEENGAEAAEEGLSSSLCMLLYWLVV